MTANLRSTDQKPNAWIVNPKDKGRKSVKINNKVYLKDGQNFEIELHNPLQQPVLAEIKINGKSVSSTGLVLRPAERFYLDCFIDDKKKFIFKTYEVDNNEESINSISKNGLVEIFFYKEETIQFNNWKDRFNVIIEKHYYPTYYPWYVNIGPYSGYPYSGTTTTIFNNYDWNTTNLLNVCSTNYDTSNLTYTNTNINSYSDNKLETGRIEKGTQSSQQFESINMEFENYHISSIVYQLLPDSQKPVETKEIKNFCSNCGKKIKSENFCSNCGEKLK